MDATSTRCATFRLMSAPAAQHVLKCDVERAVIARRTMSRRRPASTDWRFGRRARPTLRLRCIVRRRTFIRLGEQK